jgi:hypothetical protein
MPSSSSRSSPTAAAASVVAAGSMAAALSEQATPSLAHHPSPTAASSSCNFLETHLGSLDAVASSSSRRPSPTGPVASASAAASVDEAATAS